jgi:hypothetical protein
MRAIAKLNVAESHEPVQQYLGAPLGEVGPFG